MFETFYPKELLLNTINTSDTEAPFIDLNSSLSIDIISSKIHDGNVKPIAALILV